MDAEDKIQQWIDGLTQFDLWKAVCDFYKEDEAILVDMNTEQLDKCLDSNGEQLWGLRYPADLLYTGDFRRGITITTDDEKIEFISTDPKWRNVVAPAPGFRTTLTPIIDEFGINALGVPVDREEEVAGWRNDRVSDTFRKIFD